MADYYVFIRRFAFLYREYALHGFARTKHVTSVAPFYAQKFRHHRFSCKWKAI